MAGMILLLRATGRGRTGWEPTGVVLVALLPPVWFCVEMYAHPQDVVAMGFALTVMACALRTHWIAAGVLIGLAVLTQQYFLADRHPPFGRRSVYPEDSLRWRRCDHGRGNRVSACHGDFRGRNPTDLRGFRGFRRHWGGPWCGSYM